MPVLVRTHLAYLERVDATFRQWWRRLDAGAQSDARQHLCELNEIESRVSTLGISWSAIQGRVDARLALMMARCPNVDELSTLESSGWVSAVQTRRHNRDICAIAAARVHASLAAAGVPARVYGGLKSAASIQGKIVAAERGQVLDLWHALRLRIVAPSIADVARVAALMVHEFGHAVWRCRNYYTHPRSQKDLYRAIHLVVAVCDRVMEIQIMSRRREIVCECDHSIVFKKTVPALTSSHVTWLRHLSHAANLVDALAPLPVSAAIGSRARVRRANRRSPGKNATASVRGGDPCKIRPT